MDEKNKIVIGGHRGTSTSSYYIKIADQSTGTLTGKDVDSKLSKADRLLDFAEKMERQVNSSSVNNLISAGEINASWVYFEIYDIPACMFVENSFDAASNIGPITIYTAADINGKLRVIDEIVYTNCIITAIESSMRTEKESLVKTFKAWFRYTDRKRNLQPYSQTGAAAGNLPSHINFPEGTLQASGGGGEGGGGGAGGGGGSGGGGGGGGGESGSGW